MTVSEPVSSGELPEWSDTTTVADWLDLPPKTLVTWRHLGTGPKYIKVGKHVRYRRADVESWLAEQYTGPQPA